MVNLRSLILLIAAIIGPVTGFAVGRDLGGWGVGVICAALGFLLAVGLTETPYRIAGWIEHRRLISTSSDKLRTMLSVDLRCRGYGYLDILRELRRRKESIDIELPRMVRSLSSSFVIDRAVGRAAIAEFFPIFGAKLAGYNPYAWDGASKSIAAELLREADPEPK